MAKKRELERIDTENNIYILPSDEEVKELVGVDPSCHHGYVTWAVCATCLDALLSIAFDELRHVKSCQEKRGRGRK